jgi:hypothetical protein
MQLAVRDVNFICAGKASGSLWLLVCGTLALTWKTGTTPEVIYFDMYHHHKTLLVFLSAALILNGCILERIFRVKNQLCDFEKNFQIEIFQGFRVLLQDPVMLDEDITWLAGAEPTEQQRIGDELVMTYIAERKGVPSDGQYDLPIELRFVRLDGEFRLKEGYLGKNLADMLTDELLTQIMQSVCKSEKSLIKQQITIDISSLDQTLLPAATQIAGILGPPNPNTGIAHKQTYDYQLKDFDAADQATVIEIYFDDTDEKILRIKVKYLRYNLDADFEKGEALLSVDIFVDRET